MPFYFLVRGHQIGGLGQENKRHIGTYLMLLLIFIDLSTALSLFQLPRCFYNKINPFPLKSYVNTDVFTIYIPTHAVRMVYELISLLSIQLTYI